MSNEEKVLIAQDMKEVGQIMSNYVGIVRSDLRNMINVGYLITRQAMERKESRGLHYTIDYPKHAYDQK